MTNISTKNNCLCSRLNPPTENSQGITHYRTYADGYIPRQTAQARIEVLDGFAGFARYQDKTPHRPQMSGESLSPRHPHRVPGAVSGWQAQCRSYLTHYTNVAGERLGTGFGDSKDWYFARRLSLSQCSWIRMVWGAGTARPSISMFIRLDKCDSG